VEDREVSTPDLGGSRGNVTRDAAVSRGSPLPDATADFVEAAGRLAAAALQRGDDRSARRLLEDALRVLDAGAPQVLRIVR
jgi:hypothetical protein